MINKKFKYFNELDNYFTDNTAKTVNSDLVNSSTSKQLQKNFCFISNKVQHQI